ncbi:glutathione S-transferase [Algirhabdus cladophorae]|uniref:glutathione S-transferase n=1 Tax=Algirhabdus cladophorae TaxID=3377108 RepID=UPI003B845D65
MSYTLYIGDRRFSTWSMRGWLMLAAFDIPHRSQLVGLYSGSMADDLAHMPLARLVPVLEMSDGRYTQDSLAMAETLHEENPGAGLWPSRADHRLRARWMVGEMHSGFSHIRNDCPGDLLGQIEGFKPSQGVLDDLARVEALFASAWAMDGTEGGWLFGDYSLADVFFAPLAGRIATYNLPVSKATQAYVQRHLNHSLFRQWRAMGLTKTYEPCPYYPELTRGAWPGPAAITAQACLSGPAENATCPYSGDPVTDFLTIDGRVFGFCNAFCRDKTVIDPAAWPDFMALYNR